MISSTEIFISGYFERKSLIHSFITRRQNVWPTLFSDEPKVNLFSKCFYFEIWVNSISFHSNDRMIERFCFSINFNSFHFWLTFGAFYWLNCTTNVHNLNDSKSDSESNQILSLNKNMIRGIDRKANQLKNESFRLIILLSNCQFFHWNQIKTSPLFSKE